jgi:molybdopterin-synthase adenylyltransferase
MLEEKGSAGHLDILGTPDERLERSLGAGERYARQALFAGIGKEGQASLSRGKVLIVGCGAIGSVLAANLGRAGVGLLRIADRDYVEGNNLQRQVLYEEGDVRRRLPKAVAAADQLRRVNHLITVEPLITDVTAENIEELLDGVDLALDGTDNFETRYLLNEACVKLGIPWIYNGVVASYGVTMTIRPHETACLRCVFPERPLPGTTPTCDTAGVLNGIVGAIAGIASTEALKLLVGSDKAARGMTFVDLWENTFDQIELPRQDDCSTCGHGRYEYLDAPLDETGTTLCGRNAVQIRPHRPADSGALDLAALAERLAPVGEVASNGYLLRLQVDGYDITLFPDARAIVKGTDDTSVARSLYAKYVGI